MKQLAFCKQVLSGDTLVILLKAGDKTIRIAGIQCPKVAIKSATIETQDEPLGFDAREFVRSKLIGQQIYVTPIAAPNSRHELMQVSWDNKDVAALLMEAGLAKLVRGVKLSNSDQLEELQKRAQQNNKGIFGDSQTVRKIRWATGDVNYIRGFAEQFNKEKLEGIIEHVRDGSNLRVYFPDSQVYCQVSMSGISAPGWRGNQPEPCAEEAKKFIELRLLNRFIPFVIDGHDGYGTLWVTPHHPRGNIVELLLEEGLASVNDTSSRAILSDVPKLRIAQRTAQEKRKGIWKDSAVIVPASKSVAPVEVITGDQGLNYAKVYPARVIDLSSGDNLTVVNLDRLTSPTTPIMSDVAANERRVYLASIRAPRPRTRQRDGDPWAQDALELVRDLTAGRKVKVVVDYVRVPQPPQGGGELPPASDDFGRLHFCTIWINEKDTVNAELVKRGLARVQRHRANEDRSSVYDHLLELEEEARSQKRGLHSDQEAPKHRVNDLVGPDNVHKARSLEASMRRQQKFVGMVDHVFNAGRFVVSIPSEHCRLTFLLSGLRAPQLGRIQAGGLAVESAPFADEATAWARWNLLHRKFQLEILQCDRGGNFIGNMYHLNVPMTAQNSINLKCLAAGCGKTDNMTRTNRWCDELFEAERQAVNKRIGMWALPDLVNEYNEAVSPATSIKQTDQAAPIESQASRFHNQTVLLCHAKGIDDFFVQLEDDSMLNEIMDLCDKAGEAVDAQTNSREAFTVTRPPKVGDLVLARYSKDDGWYRARIKSASGLNFNVDYLDFGNEEILTLARIIRIPPELNLIVKPPQCLNVQLAGVKTVSEFAKSATEALDEVCGNNLFTLTIVGSFQEPIVKAILTSVQDNKKSVNETLTEKGLVKVVKDVACDGKLTKLLTDAEAVAKQHRLGLWYYGDVGDSESEDEDLPMGRR